MSFNGKVVIVTGASQGIGAAIAIKFAEEGANVVIHGRNVEKLKDVAAKCKNSLIISAEIGEEEECKRIIKETIAHFGKLDVLVNNAGIIGMSEITDKDALQVFDRIMKTNVRSVVCLTNLAAPHLIATKGNIVNVSSIAGLGVASPGYFAYSSSKAALDHFGRCIALDLGPKGVRVNTVNPGPVRTNIIGNAGITEDYDYSVWDNMQKTTALNRVSEPEEVADLVVYLASDKAAGMTGSAITLDNGTLVSGRRKKF